MRSARTAFGGSLDGDRGLVTKVLMGINIVVFALGVLLAILVAGPEAAVQVLNWAGANPLSVWFASFGALGGAPAGVYDGEYYRLVTAGFLHYGLIHIALNMWVLSLFGREIERLVGRWRFVALYLLSGVGGAVAALILEPNAWLAGASGSVFGLFGAMIIFLRRLRLDPRQILLLVALNFGLGFFISGISWQGHLGGFITGLITGGVLAYAPRGPRRTAMQVGGLAVVALALIALVALSAP